ncbi:MAG: hypothetical protein ACTHU0_35175 [Kofleriaceae bacterium]
MNLDRKLAPNTIWLFALVTLGVVLAATKLIPHLTGPLTPKAMGAVYFALVGAGATAAIYFTRAGVGRSIAAFAGVAAGIGAFYYVVVARTMSAAAESFGASSSSAGGFGKTAGVVFAAVFAIDALAAGIAGTLFGAKLRKSLARPAVA